MKTSVIKGYVVVTLIVAAILSLMFGDHLTLTFCGQILLLSGVATAVVMIIRFIVEMLISGPVVRFFNRIFSAIGG